MHKQAFVTYLAKKDNRKGRTAVYYKDAVDRVLAGIQDNLRQGKKVSFLGFGTFYTRMHRGGRGMNFKTKKPMQYKPSRQAVFKPGSTLKQAVRKK